MAAEGLHWSGRGGGAGAGGSAAALDFNNSRQQQQHHQRRQGPPHLWPSCAKARAPWIHKSAAARARRRPQPAPRSPPRGRQFAHLISLCDCLRPTPRCRDGAYPASPAAASSAVDMRQLTTSLVEAREGTGEVRAILLRAAFKPRLPGG